MKTAKYQSGEKLSRKSDSKVFTVVDTTRHGIALSWYYSLVDGSTGVRHEMLPESLVSHLFREYTTAKKIRLSPEKLAYLYSDLPLYEKPKE